jgi:primosomal protein N'
VKLLYNSKTQALAQKKSEELAQVLLKEIKEKNVTIMGPSAAFLSKLAGKYRYQIVIKIKEGNFDVPKLLTIISKNFKSGCTVDVNPESLL